MNNRLSNCPGLLYSSQGTHGRGEECVHVGVEEREECVEGERNVWRGRGTCGGGEDHVERNVWNEWRGETCDQYKGCGPEHSLFSAACT